MRISDWSSDVCSSDLRNDDFHPLGRAHQKFELAGIGYADARGQFDLARDHRLYVGHKRLQIAPAAIDIDQCHRAVSHLVCPAALAADPKSLTTGPLHSGSSAIFSQSRLRTCKKGWS